MGWGNLHMLKKKYFLLKEIYNAKISEKIIKKRIEKTTSLETKNAKRGIDICKLNIKL